MKTIGGSMCVYIFVMALSGIPSAAAADNMMINADIKEIELGKDPAIGMSFTPGVQPGVVISPPDGQIGVIPGYRVRHSGVAYTIGVSCAADLSDDCSAYPYSEDYRDRQVYMRYIQVADRSFQTPEGSAVGDHWGRALKKAGKQPYFYSGDDSCVRLPSGWHACVDPMSAARTFDSNLRRSMPKKKAKIDFFYKSDQEK